MLKNIKKRNEGFTIIEVLIVLAIAGLILLVVFLAVPALQRSSRNTQRKQDIGSMLTAVSEWSNNNGGSLPAASDKTEVLSYGNFGYYKDAANISIASGTTSNNTDGDKVIIVTGASCSGDNATVSASTRRFVALYSVETRSDVDHVCQES